MSQGGAWSPRACFFILTSPRSSEELMKWGTEDSQHLPGAWTWSPSLTHILQTQAVGTISFSHLPPRVCIQRWDQMPELTK